MLDILQAFARCPLFTPSSLLLASFKFMATAMWQLPPSLPFAVPQLQPLFLIDASPSAFILLPSFSSLVFNTFLFLFLSSVSMSYRVYAFTAVKGNNMLQRFRSWIQWTWGNQSERSLASYSVQWPLQLQRCSLPIALQTSPWTSVVLFCLVPYLEKLLK